MTPELHCPLAADRIGPAGLEITVEATSGECAALARRMGLPAIESLSCEFHLDRDLAHRLVGHGHLRARIVQTCVVSLEDFSAGVDEQFTVLFIPAGNESDNDDPEALDEIPFEDGIIDLGEATAQQLALALDPYPRAPGAELPENASDPEEHQFATLAALKRLQ